MLRYTATLILITLTVPLPRTTIPLCSYKAPLGLARSAFTSSVSHVSPAGRSISSSQLARLRCIHPPFSMCASFANSVGSLTWFLRLRFSPHSSHARASLILSLSDCALVYSASEARSSALRLFGEGPRETGCVSVIGTRWLPDSSREREEWRAWM